MLLTGYFLKKCPHRLVCFFQPGFLPWGSSKIAQRGVTSDPVDALCSAATRRGREVWRHGGVLCSVVYPSRSRFSLPAVWRGGGSGGKARPPVKGEFMLPHWRLFCCLRRRDWFYIWSLELSRCVQTGLKREPITALVISIIMSA